MTPAASSWLASDMFGGVLSPRCNRKLACSVKCLPTPIDMLRLPRVKAPLLFDLMMSPPMMLAALASERVQLILSCVTTSLLELGCISCGGGGLIISRLMGRECC